MAEKYQKKEEGIAIPRVTYEHSDTVLKEQVVHYEKGTRRIIVFTIVGLLMGWFSYRYYGENFLPLKIVLAVPYKMSELLHHALHPAVYGEWSMASSLDEFFPQAPYVSRLAEFGTASLFGGAVYGSLAYFTGDKRIFTLSGYVRFGCIWAAVIGIWTAVLFGANAWQVEQNNELKQVSGFFIEGERSGSAYYADCREEIFEQLKEAFYAEEGPGRLEPAVRSREGEQSLSLIFGKYQQGFMEAGIHPEKGYLVTDQGYVYQMTEEFMEVYRQCVEEENHEAMED